MDDVAVGASVEAVSRAESAEGASRERQMCDHFKGSEHRASDCFCTDATRQPVLLIYDALCDVISCYRCDINSAAARMG